MKDKGNWNPNSTSNKNLGDLMTTNEIKRFEKHEIFELYLVDSFYENLFSFYSLKKLFPLSKNNPEDYLFFIQQSLFKFNWNNEIFVNIFVKELNNRNNWEYIKIRISEIISCLNTEVLNESNKSKKANILLKIRFLNGIDEELDDSGWDSINDDTFQNIDELEGDLQSLISLDSIQMKLHFEEFSLNYITLGDTLSILLSSNRNMIPFWNISESKEDFLLTPPEVQENVRFLTKEIYRFINHKEIHCESSLFSLGTYARWIGEDLHRTFLSKKNDSSMENKSNSISTFIIVDSLCDISQLCKCSDNLFDKILDSLKQVNGNTTDFESFDYSLLNCYNSNSKNSSTFLRYMTNVRYSSLASHGDNNVNIILKNILTSSLDSSLDFILNECIQKYEKFSGKKIKELELGKTTIEKLKTIYDKLMKEFPIDCFKYHIFFQFLSLILECLYIQDENYFKKLKSIQNVISHQTIDYMQDSEIPSSVLNLILDQIRQKIPLDEILSLLAFTYSLFPPKSKFFCENEVKALLEKEESLNNKDLRNLFIKLEYINQRRNSFKSFQQLFSKFNDKLEYESLLQKLLNQILKNEVGEDIQRIDSESISKFLSGSISRIFSGRNKSILIPENATQLYVCCIGGIRGTDIQNFMSYESKIKSLFPNIKGIEFLSTSFWDRKFISTCLLEAQS